MNLAEAVAAVLEGCSDELSELLPEGVELTSVQTFADASILSRDPGVVLRFRDGREFQMTLRRSE